MKSFQIFIYQNKENDTERFSPRIESKQKQKEKRNNKSLQFNYKLKSG